THQLKTDIDSPSLKIHERDDRLTILFTTLDYGNSSRIRYAYRLKGYEKEWNETQPGNNEAKYINVPAGSYTLQVRATDELGHWSENLTEIKLNITPYFYKTGWFYLLLVLIVIGSIWIFYHFKMRNYHKQNMLLEEKVNQRTLELAERNEQLEEMAQHVKEATEEKITFFTNITHELRTPVTLIHGPIVHALKKVQDKEIRMQLEIAERNSSYLLELINELMDFRKLDMDRVVLDKSTVNLIELISDLLFPFQLFAKERQIEIRLLHRITTPYIELDAAYIRKAMVNLISNAIKFTPDNGRVDVFIASIKNEFNESLLYINVCDTGHGINEKEIEKIFDRFYQSKHSVKYTVNGHSGTGIGLSLCKKVVDLHEGTIFARNNPTRGASIRILLPLTAAAIGYDQPTSVTKEKKQEICITEIGEQKRDTLLIVEDNRDMRTYIRSILSAEYNLLEAENGEEALQILQRASIDLIVSDLMMPKMDGMELSRRVKEDFSTSHIPFLMLTAVRSEAQEKKSFQLGVDEYLYKPFDEEMLLLRVRNIIELRNKYKKMFSTTSKIDELQVKEESRDQLFMKRAIELMNQYYHDSEYNLECFVRDMGYSKTLVNKKMQDLTGQPIGQFMKNYRLNVAQKMITENPGNINVSEIAYAVGYNDPKYFTRCFKELFGYLPSAKIKKLQ
ncbi:MAG: hybrid sensor histidine kinase/response regulator transcription factor, partial [Phocaeicola sp.]